MGRKPLTIVELDLDFCIQEFGVAPCLATGAKCYKTRKTCKYPLAYSTTPKTYRFCENIAGLPVGLDAIPCIKTVSTAPTRITPSKGLGYRASVSIEFTDFTHHDRGVDPYLSTRSYDPSTQGTYFGKLLARNPYYKGRTIRIYSGYLAADGSYDVLNFDKREYIIDSFEVANSKGKVVVKGKDVLSKTDADKAQAPIASTGTLVLAITDIDTSLTLQTGEGVDYNDPAVTLQNEYIRIDNEIIQYTTIAGDVLSGLTRATWRSIADTHDADTSVQQCLPFEGTNCVDVIETLLKDYANIDAALIPSAKWAVEKAAWLSLMNVSAIITKPEGVNKLVGELSEQSLLNIWWDERLQEVTLKAVSPYSTDTAFDDDNHFLDVSVKDMPADRISEIFVYYDMRDRTNPTKEESYKSVYVQADLESELPTKHDEKKIKIVMSRWYTSKGAVVQFASRTLKWMNETPINAKFKLDAKDGNLWTGDPFDLISSAVQGADGAPLLTEMLVLEAYEDKNGDFNYLAMNSPFFGRYAVIMANGTPDYAGLNIGGWIAPTAAGFTDGSEAFKIA